MLKIRPIKLLSLFFIIFVYASCNITQTKTKKIEFKSEFNEIVNNLRDTIKCEHINLNGTEKKAGEQKSSELEIKIINLTDVPSDETQLRTIGKMIASEFKKALKNPGDFNIYKVLFITQKAGDGKAISNYIGYSFNSEDI